MDTQIKTELIDTYRKNGLVLMLGSGVSADSKIPTWEGLFSRMALKILSGRDSGLVHNLRKCDFSFPVIASFLEERCTGTSKQKRETFVGALREALYEEFYPHHHLKPRGKFSKKAREQFIETVRGKSGNTSLRSVGALCGVKTESGFRPNPRIHAIVTQNVDWLLQAFVRTHFDVSGKRILVRTIERPSAPRSTRKIPLYHMHGMLRFDDKQKKPPKEAQDRVVFTEQDYFNIFNDPTSIFNYTLLHLMRERHFLFFGLSMKDENLRRLLHYSKRERARSLEDEGLTDSCEIREKVTRHIAILPRSDVPAVDCATSDTLAPLGVRVLWIDDFAEIPGMFQEMYESTGEGEWQMVYNGVS